jgi:dihydroflavonol-4-reductase
VFISSMNSIIDYSKPLKQCYTEDDWANYAQNPGSKKATVIEQTVWNLYKNSDKSNRFKLTVLNPSWMLGPLHPLNSFDPGTHILKLMNGMYKNLMKLSHSIVDIRDVAAASIAALESSVSDGQRYICCSGETLWHSEMADILRAEFGRYGYPIPNSVFATCPDHNPSSIRALGWDKRFELSNAKIRKDLGLTFIPPKESILKMAYSLIDNGFLPKLF